MPKIHKSIDACTRLFWWGFVGFLDRSGWVGASGPSSTTITAESPCDGFGYIIARFYGQIRRFRTSGTDLRFRGLARWIMDRGIEGERGWSPWPERVCRKYKNKKCQKSINRSIDRNVGVCCICYPHLRNKRCGNRTQIDTLNSNIYGKACVSDESFDYKRPFDCRDSLLVIISSV